MLHYSLTISVGFPHFAALFVGLAGAVFFVVRYRVGRAVGSNADE